ncbi:hypothetical protein [Marilutibacter spongiae]|uniref:Uncharacterized protein n=1 Tax=Marilutibacter spongiae TaxID=2025720 RepID=A0A7W3TMP5_9GAMM|nr:hypothetical protein [Lysobacter spongiae]MBB1061180.1 hypothetical protein [Lysobacter spongiae]
MDMKTLLVAHTLIAGACGIPARLRVAGFLLSSESIRSPRIARRYFYRYLLFCFYYLVSFMLTPLVLKPVLPYFRDMAWAGKGYLYFLLCIPLAIIMYVVDYRFICWADGPKLRARARLAEKLSTHVHASAGVKERTRR